MCIKTDLCPLANNPVLFSIKQDMKLFRALLLIWEKNNYSLRRYMSVMIHNLYFYLCQFG